MSFDLTNKNISDTFQNLLQKTGSEGHLYDLIGNKVDNLTIGGTLTAHSYITSESIVNTSSGSTAFGNSSDDTHQFTGHITSSGNISSSITSTGSFGHLFADTSLEVDTGLIYLGPSAGNGEFTIEANSNSGFEFRRRNQSTNIATFGWWRTTLGHYAQTGEHSVRIHEDAWLSVGVPNGTYLGNDDLPPEKLTVIGNISASGNLFLSDTGTIHFKQSGRGTITGSALTIESPMIQLRTGSSAGAEFGRITNGNLGIGTTNPTVKLQVEGIISASGGISSSQDITGANLSGTNTGDQDLSGLAVKTAITGAFAEPSSSFSTRVTTLETNPSEWDGSHIGDANITGTLIISGGSDYGDASLRVIPTSSLAYGLLITGSTFNGIPLALIQTSGSGTSGTGEFIYGKGKDGEDSFRLRQAAGGAGTFQLYSSASDGGNQFITHNFEDSFQGGDSYVNYSADSRSDAYFGIGTNNPDTHLHVSGNAKFTGDIQVGTGTVNVRGTVGQITASGDISSSGIISASSLHSSGNSTFTGIINTTGNISSSGHVYGKEGVIGGGAGTNVVADRGCFVITEHTTNPYWQLGANATGQMTFDMILDGLGGGDNAVGQKMILSTDGYLGVNWDSNSKPSARLTVVGDISASTGININRGTAIKSYNSAGAAREMLMFAGGNVLQLNDSNLDSETRIFGQNTQLHVVNSGINVSTGDGNGGHITASGNISSSGDLIVGGDITQIGTGAEPFLSASSGNLVLSGSGEGELIVAGNISSSGNITANKYYGNDDDSYMEFTDDAFFVRAGSDSIRYQVTSEYTRTILPFRADSHITASGNIKGGGNLELTASSAGNIYANGHITASGIISSSSTIKANSIEPNGIFMNGAGVLTFRMDDNTGVGISSTANSKLLFHQPDDTAVPFLEVEYTGINVTGNITASGDISSSGGDIFSADKFKSQGVDVLDGGSNTRIGAYQGANTLRGNSITTEGYLSVAGAITASGNISASGFLQTDSYIQTDSHITASGNISASSKVYGSHIIAGGLNGLTNLNGDLDVGKDTINTRYSSPNHFFAGHITASGDISASSTSGTHTFGGTITNIIQNPTGSQNIKSALGKGYGDIINMSDATTTAGLVYRLQTNGNWSVTDKDDEDQIKNMIGVAMGAHSATHGMLIRGFVQVSQSGQLPVGNPVYLQDNGIVTGSIANFSSGDFIRVIGYCVDSGNANGSASIYFNPDNTWVEKA